MLIGGFGRAAETTGGIAGLVGGYVVEDVPLSELARYASSVQAVDPKAVQSAAHLFDPSRASIVVVGDAKSFVEDLRKTYPQLEVVPAAELKLDGAALR